MILFQRENTDHAKKAYTQEFKREDVRLVQPSGKPIAQVARGWAFLMP